MMRSVLLFLITCLCLCTVHLSAAPSAAEEYSRWVQSCIDDVERDIPAMRASAEAAAQRYIATGAYICTRGDTSFAMEITYRSGGLFNLTQFVKEDAPNIGQVGIVLYAVREHMLELDVACINELRRQGIDVVAFGNAATLVGLRDAGIPPTMLVEIPAAPHNGLFRGANDRWLIPTRPVANGITIWTWVGEFVAACTREGKMPVMYQGDAVKGKVRMAKFPNMKLHPDYTPTPVPAGELGQAYLTELRATMMTIAREELPDIQAAATLAADAHREGHGVYAFLHGHGMLFETLTGPHDSRVFTKLNDDWFRQRKDITLQAGDVVFCDGFDSVFQGKRWHEFAEQARAVGATLIWSITDYRSAGVTQDLVNAAIDPEGSQADAYTIPPDEIFINQHWALGDAVVDVPGYDVKILPTSGVIGQSILWMLQAETADRLGLLAREQ